MREDLRFEADGVELAGVLLRPDGAGPHPLVVLSHGFSAVMAMGLLDYAELFRAAGLACLVYEHRGFGASGGEPRHEIDPWRQVADMRDALSYARTLPGIDPARIGLWGTSYAGGHALAVAALDRRVCCVVSQVPLVEGHATLRSWIGEANWALMQQRFADDRDARYRGEVPRITKPARPGDQTWDWVVAIGAEAIYPNRITQRSLELIASYEPGQFVTRIAPTPLMMILASDDTQTPYAGQLAAFERAGEPKKLVTIAGGHYDPYTTSFGTAAGAARDWFLAHLAP
ncbi:MAG TPA: alpha/beta fold hydrolase [Gammaproteobacteria bacterium]|nr:alpha/beta fold hydrolase [Gammaproteobacteria bacterium]